MKPLFTAASVRALDAAAIAKGVVGLVLMENAGRGATDVLFETLSDHLGALTIVGGPGQNGGDAWVVARHARTRGVPCRAILVAPDLSKVKGDARVNLDALEKLGVDVEICLPDDAGNLDFSDASLIVDGLFGTGLDRAIEGGWAELVRAINGAGAPVLSLDVPSGVHAGTGARLGEAVEADVTVTFAAMKCGLMQFPARALSGEVHLVDIGVPPPAEGDAWLLEDGDVRGWLAPRPEDGHKGRAGHVLVVGGSKPGAAQLASLGALRAGAGLVTLAGAETRHAEVMTTDDPMAALRNKDAFVVGPGLGLDDRGQQLAYTLALEPEIPGVLDADALTHWAERGLEGLKDARGPRVLTPHPGEAGRLLGVPAADVQARRYEAAEELANRTGQVVILKGAGSIVASASGLWVTDAGTPALGVAGTGDVLSGVVGALLAQLAGGTIASAAAAAVHWHARAGELAADSDRGLLASEVANALPRWLG